MFFLNYNFFSVLPFGNFKDKIMPFSQVHQFCDERYPARLVTDKCRWWAEIKRIAMGKESFWRRGELLRRLNLDLQKKNGEKPHMHHDAVWIREMD